MPNPAPKRTTWTVLKQNTRPLIAVVTLVGCFVFVGFHFKEVSGSLAVLQDANPWWVAIAFVTQILTYVAAGGIFYEILRAAKLHLPLSRLAALSIERISVNQIAPAAGLSGNVYVFMAFRRFGIPRGIAAEAVFLDTLAYHVAYALCTVLALGIVLGLHQGSLLIVGGLLIYLLVTAALLAATFWFFSYMDRDLPGWLTRWKMFKEVSRSLKAVRPERLQAPWVLSIITFYELAVFMLDGVTLWAIMHIIHVPLSLLVCFTIFMIASVAAAMSLLPGGVGSFEAVCVLALRWFGVPLGPALTATLLVRLLTLWLPLIPGSIFAAKYVVDGEQAELNSTAVPSLQTRATLEKSY